MTAHTRRAYWHKDGDDLVRGGYRIERVDSGRLVTCDGIEIAKVDTLTKAKNTANDHEDGNL